MSGAPRCRPGRRRPARSRADALQRHPRRERQRARLWQPSAPEAVERVRCALETLDASGAGCLLLASCGRPAQGLRRCHAAKARQIGVGRPLEGTPTDHGGGAQLPWAGRRCLPDSNHHPGSCALAPQAQCCRSHRRARPQRTRGLPAARHPAAGAEPSPARGSEQRRPLEIPLQRRPLRSARVGRPQPAPLAASPLRRLRGAAAWFRRLPLGRPGPGDGEEVLSCRAALSSRCGGLAWRPVQSLEQPSDQSRAENEPPRRAAEPGDCGGLGQRPRRARVRDSGPRSRLSARQSTGH